MHRIGSVVALVAVALVLPSCGSGAGGLSVGIGDPFLEIVRGAAASVAVTVSGGGLGPTTLGISGLPSGVTATFDPAELSAGSTTSTLVLDVARSASEVTAELTILATRGELLATAALSLAVSSLTVEGTVVTLLGDGHAGVSVAIDGTTAVSGPGGAFTIGGVAVPYDLVAYAAGAGGYGHVFVGLATDAPEVLPWGVAVAEPYQSGTLTGTVPVIPLFHRTRVCAEGTSRRVHGCDELGPIESDVSITALWGEGGSAAVRLHALEMELDDDGFPVAYTGYGTADGVTSDGATSDVGAIAYPSAPGSTQVSASLAAAVGYTVTVVAGSARVSPNLTMPVFRVTGSTTALSVPMPVLGDATYTLVAVAQGLGGGSTAAWAADLDGSVAASVAIPAAATLVSPPDGAAALATTPFVAADAGGGARTFTFSDTGADFTFLVTTMHDSVTLPNLTELGLPPPGGGTTYDWAVSSSPSSTSTEEAGFGWIGHYALALATTQTGGPGPPADGSFSVSATRTFTAN